MPPNVKKSKFSQVSESSKSIYSARSRIINMANEQCRCSVLFSGVVIHGGQISISINSLNQSPTLVTPTEKKPPSKRYKRLIVEFIYLFICNFFLFSHMYISFVVITLLAFCTSNILRMNRHHLDMHIYLFVISLFPYVLRLNRLT